MCFFSFLPRSVFSLDCLPDLPQTQWPDIASELTLLLVLCTTPVSPKGLNDGHSPGMLQLDTFHDWCFLAGKNPSHVGSNRGGLSIIWETHSPHKALGSCAVPYQEWLQLDSSWVILFALALVLKVTSVLFVVIYSVCWALTAKKKLKLMCQVRRGTLKIGSAISLQPDLFLI